jgi:tetratricopeptide (TPR) repeat protein
MEENSQQNYEELIERARAAYTSLHLAEALQAYQAAQTLQPNSYAAQVGIAQTLLRMRHQDEAIAASEKAIALDPNRFEAYAALGSLYFLADRLDDGIVTLQKAIALAPASPEPHLTLAQTYADQKRFDEARAEINTAREQLETIKDETQRQQVLAITLNAETYLYLEQGKANDAVETAQKALALEEANPYAATLAYSNLGILAARNRRYDEAIEYLEHAYQLNPYLTRVGMALARFLILRNKPARAAEILGHILEEQPASGAPNRYFYAEALAKLGRRAEALPQYRQALAENLTGVESLKARWQLIWLHPLGRAIVIVVAAAAVLAWILLAKPTPQLITFAAILVVILILQRTIGRRRG